jgi:pantoate--beta-alanine ligase
MTALVSSVREWREIRAGIAADGQTVGLVPTMGALHEGHAALCRRARAETDVVVASVFDNPTQFNDPADLRAYPRTPEADRSLLAGLGVPYLFAPDEAAIYADGYRYGVVETELSGLMEGAHRPVHFNGVLTVVLRLLSIVLPHRAYFGEKDYQQYLLVRDMAKAFFVDVEIVPCPIEREPNGLARSSRNARLTAAGRELAGRFARRLAGDGPADTIRRDLEAMGIEVQYVEEHLWRRFAAVVIEGVRLIDNVPLV